MTRAKSKRVGSRGGGTNVGKKPRAALPDDLADAAEAALDDLLGSSVPSLDDDDEPGTRAQPAKRRGVSTHEVSLEDMIPLDDDEAEIDEPLADARPRRLPSKVAPLATAMPPPGYKPPTAELDSLVDATNPVEHTDVEELEEDEPPTALADRQQPAPARTSAHTIARNPTPPPAMRTPTPQPALRTPAPEPVTRASAPSASRLPLPAPTRTSQSSLTLEAPTNRPSGQLTREAKRPDTDERRAWLDSAKFGDSDSFERAEAAPAPLPPAPLANIDLESAQFDRISESASLDRISESAPFDSVAGESPLSGVPLDSALADLAVELSAPFEIPALRFAVYEDAAYVSSAQTAITEAGHIVSISGAGRDAVKRVSNALHAGGIDVLLASLPGGESIIDVARTVEPRPTIIASLSASSVEAVSAATASGADLATTRPHDVERMAPLALAAARIAAARREAASAKGAEQVLRQRLEDLADAEPGGLLPFEMFQRVLELEIKRAKRFEYPLSVALFAVEIAPPPPPAGIRGILRARAGNALINTIRDIDIATQLDHERFLVLLPYTDLKGAGAVGKRVISAVAKGQPVVSDGRSFPPRVVGAVAGMKKGEQISFAKLIKDATRALENARRDGADLAVQP